MARVDVGPARAVVMTSFSIYHIVRIFVQGFILAQNLNKCYPEWVVFFIYRNMALSQVPSDIIEANQKLELSGEARNRVNIVAQSAIDLLEKNPDNKSAISKLFGEMVSNNLRDPENIGKIQDGLYTARDARLKNANPNERLSILE